MHLINLLPQSQKIPFIFLKVILFGLLRIYNYIKKTWQWCKRIHTYISFQLSYPSMFTNNNRNHNEKNQQIFIEVQNPQLVTFYLFAKKIIIKPSICLASFKILFYSSSEERFSWTHFTCLRNDILKTIPYVSNTFSS